jgi:acyl-homoserine-lactone acylase
MKYPFSKPNLSQAILLVLLTSFTISWPAIRTAGAPNGIDNTLGERVTIRRDTYGVPHILAETEEAAAFAQGYVVAEDHLLELARLFLKARSEEAAYFGETYANADLLTREMRMYDYAEAGYRKSPPLIQMILDAYAAGYNRYVEQHRSELPDWVKPVSGIDVLAHSRRVTVMEFSMNIGQVFTASNKRVARDQNWGYAPGPDEVRGSNMWAIGKDRSASGKGILLGNPHLAWAGSQLFHEVQITVPGKINVSGTTLIGIPGVAIGFNENLGWSHTVNLHDSDDVYELTLDPNDPHRYLYEGRSLPMEKTEVEVKVKTNSGIVARKKDAYWCHYGPVLKFAEGKAYALKSANIGEYRFIEQWNLMAKARNLDEFRRALDLQGLPMFNICYADREGNCFYIFNGRFPDRPRGYDWTTVAPGNITASEWNHVLPENKLPLLLNPPGGYVQNSNSAPWYTNLHAIIDRTKYPEELTPNMNGLRTQLSLEMIEGDTSITLDEVLKYKYNMKLMLADRVKPELVRLARGKTVDSLSLDDAAKVLNSWDNTVSRASRGSMLFVTFWNKYKINAKPVYAVDWDEHRPSATPRGIGDNKAALEALAWAAKEIKQKYGSLDVSWGETHRLRRGSLDVAIGGLTDEYGAFRVIAYRLDKDGKYVAAGGDSYVLAVEFTSPPTAYSVVAYSTTDDAKSAHHNDQSKLFAEEKWKRAWFTEQDIKMNTERSYHP